MSIPDPMVEIRASFFVECEELLEALQDGLQALDDGSHDDETIHVVFRAVHSIKGGAGAFGIAYLVDFSHRYENVLDQVRNGRVEVTPDLLLLFFRAADQLSDIVRACRDERDVPTGAGDAVLSELDALVSGVGEQKQDETMSPAPLHSGLDREVVADGISPDVRSYVIFFAPDAELYATGNDAPHIFGALADMGTLNVTCDTSRLPALDQLNPTASYLSWSAVLSTEVPEAEVASMFEFVEGLCELEISIEDDSSKPPEPAPASASADIEATTTPPEKKAPSGDQNSAGSHGANAVVRVDVDRIERLVNLVGELVINQAMLAESLQGTDLSPHSDAMNGLEEFQRLTRDIQDSVMMIRAQPVKSLFQRMARIVRETSAAVGKDVRLITEGDTTEVDKTVIERLADPLTHMIRNAVDHGLEDTQTRLENGKPAQGQVRLSAAHKSGRVVIDVSDDGGGINRDRVLQIAIDKGLIPADSTLSDTEIDNLLFLPGFSTAEQVSDLSGRGVGMDVVRAAIQALGGRIIINSEAGRGTTFCISLPLTLAVLDGMVVDVSGETLVLPLNVVSETLTLSDATVEYLQPGKSVVRVRDGFVPLFDLGAALGYRPPCDTYDDRVALLLALEDGTRVALVVDEIQDQRQVVIKGLDDNYYRAPGIAAATILGDGQIALILDPADIIAHAPKQPAPVPTHQSLEA